MKSIVTYIRNLMGWCEENPVNRLSFKRDRADEGFSSEDDSPAFKRPKQLLRTKFPSVMTSNDGWEKEEKLSNVRHIPIQIERVQPSTSTPLESSDKLGRRVRTVPIELVGIKDKTLTPARRLSSSKPKPVFHAVLDEDEEEVTLVESRKKPEVIRKPKYYVNLDDYENIEDYENDPKQSNDDDVIYVKKVTAPPSMKPYRFFLSNDQDVVDSEEPVYYKLSNKISDRNSNSPRSKFIVPPGITKSYKRTPTPVSRWLAGPKMNNPRNKYFGLNGNTRTSLSEVFNLDEKKNYQELIKRVAGTIKPASFGRPLEIVDLADDFASFRNTQRAQKKALHEITLVEKGISADKQHEFSKEYDPITVASINSSDSEVEVVPSETSTSSSMRIDPINSLKDSYRDKAVTSGDWLSKIDIKYRKKKLETQAKLADARRESDIISKVNNEQKIAQLEHKLKHELSIPESLFEEPQPTVELPALTPDQLKLVNRALGPGPAGQLLVEKFNLRIHRRDLQTLSGLNWLNDEVINFYMNLLMQRSEERKDLPRVYAANTFFYPKLMQAGQAGLRRWTRKVDIFSHDLMVIPVHLGVHWCVSLIHFKDKRIHYLDSMGGRNQRCLDALLQYLRDEHKDKKGTAFDDSGWTTECLKDIPQQMNGSDCGMFSCTFAEFSSRGAPYTFTQAHMPYLRRKAALEILMGKLLL